MNRSQRWTWPMLLAPRSLAEELLGLLLFALLVLFTAWLLNEDVGKVLRLLIGPLLGVTIAQTIKYSWRARRDRRALYHPS